MTGRKGQQGLPLWHAAAALAARAHQGQVRKDRRTPYIAHPFRVAMTVRDLFGCEDPDCIAAAILHDVIEDSPVDYDDVLETCGERTADIVAALTKDMRLREDRREPAYDEQIRAAGWRAALVKMADTFDNLSDMLQRRDDPDPAKLVSRCRRAIGIAESLEGSPPEVARGIAVLEGLIARYGGGAPGVA